LQSFEQPLRLFDVLFHALMIGLGTAATQSPAAALVSWLDILAAVKYLENIELVRP
jgi:hypothetical protein